MIFNAQEVWVIKTIKVKTEKKRGPFRSEAELIRHAFSHGKKAGPGRGCYALMVKYPNGDEALALITWMRPVPPRALWQRGAQRVGNRYVNTMLIRADTADVLLNMLIAMSQPLPRKPFREVMKEEAERLIRPLHLLIQSRIFSFVGDLRDVE